jgi:hypothetical protein
MKRTAILIEASNVSGQKDLPGARIDIENWKNYLKSDLAGAWTENEIQILRKPLSSQVADAITQAASGYTFVAFSGHGAEGSVALNDYNTNCAISNLRPKGKKGCLIIDSCRGVEEATSTSAKIAAANESLQNFSASDLDYLIISNRAKEVTSRNPHLAAFVAALNHANEGIVEMLSCSKGQSAGENPRAGGYYTSLLMAGAKNWESIQYQANIYSTRDAHDYAARKLPKQQTPEYKPSHLAFPFAISVT